MIVIKKKVIQQTFIVLERSFIEFTGNWTTLPTIEFHLPKERIPVKIRKDAATAALLMLLAAPISAQAGGFYVGASVGQAELSDDFGGFSVNEDSTAYRVVAGWSFNDFFALEGGYHNFGDFQQVFDDLGTPVTVSLSADGFTLGAVGSVPLTDRFSLMGRAGWYFWDGDAEINNVTQATPEDSNLYVGAGITFDVTERFQLTGDWTRYELEDVNSNVISIGLQYRF